MRKNVTRKYQDSIEWGWKSIQFSARFRRLPRKASSETTIKGFVLADQKVQARDKCEQNRKKNLRQPGVEPGLSRPQREVLTTILLPLMKWHSSSVIRSLAKKHCV